MDFMTVAIVAAITATIGAPLLVLALYLEARSRRTPPLPIAFGSMHTGRAYRVELFGEVWLEGVFVAYTSQGAVFAGNQYLRKRISDQVTVTPLVNYNDDAATYYPRADHVLEDW